MAFISLSFYQILLLFQTDESSSSPNTENLSYPIVVPDDSKLLNASLIEVHAGPLESSVSNRQLTSVNQDLINESLNFTENSMSLSLDSSDRKFKKFNN